MSCDPKDSLVVYKEKQRGYFFSDVQVRGEYPGYAWEYFKDNDIEIEYTDEDMETLKRTIEQGKDNGATNLELIDEKRLHELVPAVVGKFAMFSHNSGIVDPFGYTIALAENAHENGVEYHFG